MRIASASLPDRGTHLVSVEAEQLLPVEYERAAKRWRVLARKSWSKEGVDLRRPFAPSAVIAPGPRITGPTEWADRHREYHVKPSTVIAPARSTITRAEIDAAVYRLQVGMLFAPTPRASDAVTLRENLLGCHLVLELVSCVGFTIGWEGPRWHIRYAEGMSFDDACPTTETLVTPDEVEAQGVSVEHSGGASLLEWSALMGFAAFVNRYLDLGPELMVVGGWPFGPSLNRTSGVPHLEFDAPIVRSGMVAWAQNDRLGRIECALGAGTP